MQNPIQHYHPLLKEHLARLRIEQRFGDEEAWTTFLEEISDAFDAHEREKLYLENTLNLYLEEKEQARRQAEEEMEKQRVAEVKNRRHMQILRSIHQNIQEALFRSEPGKGLVYVNDTFVELFGLESREEALNRLPDSFYHDPEDRMRILHHIQQNGGYVRGMEVLFVKKDGSTFWGLVNSIYTQDELGKPVYDGAIVDISAQKQIQETLRLTNEELTKTNAELDRFVYSASHDLRAPLKSLLGLLNIAQLEEGANWQDYLNRFRETVVKLDNFIGEIIDYSRNSRTGLVIEALDLELMVRESIEKLAYIRHAQRVDYQVSVQANAQFYSDKGRVRMVLHNLIANAILYQKPDDAHQPYLRIRMEISASEAVLVLEDNGIGIPKHHQERIFEMFYRASTDSNGSGLGLYIVQEAVSALGGRISLASEEGIGTTFTIDLPNHLRQ